MRRLLAALLGVAVTPQLALGRDSTPNIVVEAVADLSNDDPAAIDAARRALRDGPSEDGLFAHMTGEMREFAIIADSLEGTGRLISLDWKEDLSEARAKFTALFAKSGINPDDALARIDRGADAIVESGVGLAYAAFRVTVRPGIVCPGTRPVPLEYTHPVRTSLSPARGIDCHRQTPTAGRRRDVWSPHKLWTFEPAQLLSCLLTMIILIAVS